jgi:lipocalin
MGVWYEQERYYVFFEDGDTCVKTTYSENTDGSWNIVGDAIEAE